MAFRSTSTKTRLLSARARACSVSTLRVFCAPAGASELPPLGSPQTLLVGTGGAALILARIHLALPDFTREKMEGLSLSAQEVSAICQRLWSLPLAERRQIIGLPPERADVMLMQNWQHVVTGEC